MGKIFGISDILNAVFNRDANKLKVETDLQIDAVTVTDVAIHDAVATDNKLKVNEDGSVPVELKGSIVEETTLQNEVIAPADGTTVAMGGRDKIKIEITGTATSSTVVFEVAGASGVFVPVQGVRLSDYTIATQTGSKNEIWAIDSIAGLTFRARVSAVAGGNITVVGLVVA